MQKTDFGVLVIAAKKEEKSYESFLKLSFNAENTTLEGDDIFELSSRNQQQINSYELLGENQIGSCQTDIVPGGQSLVISLINFAENK